MEGRNLVQFVPLILIILIFIAGAVVVHLAFIKVDAIQKERDELWSQGCVKVTTDDNCTVIKEGWFVDIVECDEYILCLNETAVQKCNRCRCNPG